MLKKSLIAIAILAIALPAVAGDLKVHDPWPTSYVKQKITTIDVILDVGYYIHVKDQKPVEIFQDTSASNPYETYSGCKKTDVVSNFEAAISGKITKKSAAEGDWKVKFGVTGSSSNKDTIVIPAGTTNIEICASVTKFKIEKLVGSTNQGLGGVKNLKVAEIEVLVVPAN
jgi:hypothetical protein